MEVELASRICRGIDFWVSYQSVSAGACSAGENLETLLGTLSHANSEIRNPCNGPDVFYGFP